MMYGNKGFNAYKNNSVNYASKDQLLLMLVDGAVKFAKISRQAIADKDIKKAHESIIRTQDIFIELMATLDRSNGQWSEQIFRVYEFINSRLVEANLKKSVEIMDEVLPLIEDVRDTWNEAYKLSKK
ncbi:flagellar protein FliS [Clostridium frigidicarnis]|uniref:Flagellar secretion chaperone FliS n=2 Tax=Clostridium frigidicarnis TaxID=84698 RepID=A0A1I0VDC2_9CLOT|nr:flagellar protein FliS [Clostridium frigidicarnis]